MTTPTFCRTPPVLLPLHELIYRIHFSAMEIIFFCRLALSPREEWSKVQTGKEELIAQWNGRNASSISLQSVGSPSQSWLLALCIVCECAGWNRWNRVDYGPISRRPRTGRGEGSRFIVSSPCRGVPYRSPSDDVEFVAHTMWAVSFIFESDYGGGRRNSW